MKLDIENEMKINKSSSRIFRLLIGTLITDDDIWARGNATAMFEGYQMMINACIGLLVFIIFGIFYNFLNNFQFKTTLPVREQSLMLK